MMMKSRYMTPGKIGSKMAPAEDNLGLTIPAFDEEVETRQKISEDAMRELRDENGRLFKLLAEKEFETKQLRKKLEAEKDKNCALGEGSNGVIGRDAVAAKIVDISRKNRELSCDLESERNKSKQWMMKCRESENEIRRLRDGDDGRKKFQPVLKEGETPEDVIKQQQDKIAANNAKVLELKAQLEAQKQTVSKIQRALEKEIGTENINIQNILNGNSNWQGRTQKIINLQNKVSELNMRLKRYEQLGHMVSMESLSQPEGHVKFDPHSRRRSLDEVLIPPEEEDYDDGFPSLPSTAVSSATCRKNPSALPTSGVSHPNQGTSTQSPLPPPGLASARAINENKQYSMIRKYERDRKEALEKATDEVKNLGEAKVELAKKTESLKARVRVLSSDLKASKTQISTLLGKGKHDDELVKALMGQLSSMKDIVDGANKDKSDKETSLGKEKQEMQEKLKNDTSKMREMEETIDEKEKRIQKLQNEIIELQKNMIKKSGTNEAMESRLGPLFVANLPPEVTPIHLPSIYPGTTSAETPSPPRSSPPRSSLPKSKIPASKRADSRGRCKSRVDRPLSSNAAMEKTNEEMKIQIQELRCLGRVAEVERDRLTELLQVVEDRSAKQCKDKVSLQTRVQELQRKIARLEKVLERNQLNPHKEATTTNEKSAKCSSAGVAQAKNGRKATAGSYATAASAAASARRKPDVAASAHCATSVPPRKVSVSEEAWAAGDWGIDTNLDELEARLETLQDENEALRRTLETTLDAKRQDLTLLQEMIEQTKGIFLKGIKELKAASD